MLSGAGAAAYVRQVGDPPALDAFTRVRRLGAGNFGAVFEEEWARPDSAPRTLSVAVKYMAMSAPEAVTVSQRELDVLSRCNCGNVVSLLWFTEMPGYRVLVLELVRPAWFDGLEWRSDLQGWASQEWLRRKAPSEAVFRPLAWQLLSGLRYLHSVGVVHRDLKPANVLVADLNLGREGEPRPEVKLCDFGLAKSYAHHSNPNTAVGTGQFMPPELWDSTRVAGAEYNGFAADVWSAGGTIYSVLTMSAPGVRPLELLRHDPQMPEASEAVHLLAFNPVNPAVRLNQIIIKKLLELEDRISPHCYRLLLVMMQPEPNRRWTAEQVLSHPWFTQP